VDEFRPERFMKGDNLDPSVPVPAEAFGFGRRICAGRASAETSLWITIASMLSVFELEGPEGFTEKDYGNFITGLVVYAHSITVKTEKSFADKRCLLPGPLQHVNVRSLQEASEQRRLLRAVAQMIPDVTVST
jgi:hypothetical protein